MASFKQVVAVARALEVLRVINSLGSAAIGDIHKQTGLDKATIVRLVETLISEGYVVKRNDKAAYVPGRKVLGLSSGFSRQDDLTRKGALILEKYHTEVSWPLTLTVCDQEAMRIVEAYRTVRGLTMLRDADYRFPLLVTSPGRAYYAFLPEEERDKIRIRLTTLPDPSGWNRMAHDREAVNAMVADVREKGYALSDKDFMDYQYEGMLWGVALPLAGKDGVHGAVSTSILSHVHARGEALETYLPVMRRIAQEITEAVEGPREPAGAR